MRLEMVSENKTSGIEKVPTASSLTATQISRTVLAVIGPFKYLV